MSNSPVFYKDTNITPQIFTIDFSSGRFTDRRYTVNFEPSVLNKSNWFQQYSLILFSFGRFAMFYSNSWTIGVSDSEDSSLFIEVVSISAGKIYVIITKLRLIFNYF